jgi:hypothetical protein
VRGPWLRNIESTDVQIDEIWGIISKKKKNANPFETKSRVTTFRMPAVG